MADSERKIIEEVSGVSELAKELQDSVSTLISKTTHEEQCIRQRAIALGSNIRTLRSSIAFAVQNGGIDRKDAEKLDAELYRAKCLLNDGDVASFLLIKQHGGFLRMFLGPICVRANKKDVQLKVKEEYNSYRDRTAFMFLLFPSALLLLRAYVWSGCLPTLPVQLYQAWLLFLYKFGFA